MRTVFTSLFQPTNLRQAKIGLFLIQAINGTVTNPNYWTGNSRQPDKQRAKTNKGNTYTSFSFTEALLALKQGSGECNLVIACLINVFFFSLQVFLTQYPFLVIGSTLTQIAKEVILLWSQNHYIDCVVVFIKQIA